MELHGTSSKSFQSVKKLVETCATRSVHRGEERRLEILPSEEIS